MLLFVACVPVLDGFTNIGAVDFRRNFAFHKEFAIMVVPKLCGIVVGMIAAALLHSYVALLFGIGINRLLRVVMSYVMHPYRPAFSLATWRGLAGYSIWTWLLSLVVLLRDRSDSLLLGRLLNIASVGYYALGAEIAELPSTELIEPLGRAAFSGFAAARQQQQDVGQTYLRLIGSAALLTLPVGVGLSLVAAPLVALAFGSGWDQAVPVLRILSLSFTAMVFGHLSMHLLTTHARLGRLVGITLVGAVVRVGLLAVLIPRFGLIGAAMAAATAVLLEQVLTVGFALRRLGLRPVLLLRGIWRPVLGAVVMAGALWLSGLGWTDDTGVQILAEAIAAGAIVYTAALWGSWWLAGRPAGAETDLLALLRWSAG